MAKRAAIKSELIAPCGMNCGICVAYLRERNRCPGCRLIDKISAGESNKRYCKKCMIKNCEILRKKGWKFCNTRCESYPCRRLKDLDKRYRMRYDMSMLDNLEYIEKNGIRKFLRQQKKRYIKNDKVICVHNNKHYDI